MDIIGAYSSKHLIQAEVRLPKIKELCVATHTFLILKLMK